MIGISKYVAYSPSNASVKAWVMTLEYTSDGGYYHSWFDVNITRQRNEAAASTEVLMDRADYRDPDPHRSAYMPSEYHTADWNDDLLPLTIDVDITNTQDGFTIDRVEGDTSDPAPSAAVPLRVPSCTTDWDCIICFDKGGIDDRWVKLPCGHQYHASCAVRWLAAHRTCPECRRHTGLGSLKYCDKMIHLEKPKQPQPNPNSNSHSSSASALGGGVKRSKKKARKVKASPRKNIRASSKKASTTSPKKRIATSRKTKSRVIK